jgi:hypothetical protein
MNDRWAHAGARLAVAASLGIAAITLPRASAASTAEITAQLEYAAAPACPAASDFQALVVGTLGYDPFRPTARQRVVAKIEPSGRALEGRIEWRGPSGEWVGEQTFPSRTGDCAELARAMGFALALQIQLMAAAAEASRPKEPAPAPATPAPVAPEPARATERTPAAPAGPSVTVKGAESSAHLGGPSMAAGAGAAVGLGVSSNAAAVGRLFGTLAWSHVALELGGEISAPSVTHRADGAGFSQMQLLATVAGCGTGGPWSACMLAKYGQLRVEGQGVDVPATAAAPMLQAGLRLALTQQLGGRFQMVVHGEGLTRIVEGTVTLDAMPVWTTPRFAALFGVDLAVRFR